MPARVMERNNKLEDAALTWERIADEYSGSEQVPDALFSGRHYALPPQ